MDPQAFRETFSRLASGITVVTTKTQGGIHGMTATAFLPVSLDPPLVLVSVDRKARMHGHLGLGQPFAVNLLKAEQKALSDRFAGRGEGEVAFGEWEGIPFLPGTLARVFARVEAVHPTGDHSLFIGKVLHLEWEEGEPLLYFRLGYWGVTPL